MDRNPSLDAVTIAKVAQREFAPDQNELFWPIVRYFILRPFEVLLPQRSSSNVKGH